MRPLTLIAFDLDGTLVDSRRDISDAANDLLVACGASPLSEAAIGRMVGEGAATLVARAFAAVALPAPADALPRFLRYYDRRLVAHTRPYAGMPDVLAVLRERYTLAVLTNKPLAATQQILDRLGLADYFERRFVVGGDGPYPRKPDPTGLLALAATAGTDAAATCLVGDSMVDWQTARAAGARACLARYGFGFHSVPREVLDAGQPVVDTPQELLACL